MKIFISLIFRPIYKNINMSKIEGFLFQKAFTYLKKNHVHVKKQFSRKVHTQLDSYSYTFKKMLTISPKKVKL